MTTADNKLVYSRKEAADSLGISLRTLDSLVATKEIRVCRIRRRVVIPLDELRRFIRSNVE